MADRIGVINHGELILVQEKARLMRELGKKQLTLELTKSIDEIPAALASFDLQLNGDGSELVYTYDSQSEQTGITALLHELQQAELRFHDVRTTQSSLEEIFVDLVRRRR